MWLIADVKKTCFSGLAKRGCALSVYSAYFIFWLHDKEQQRFLKRTEWNGTVDTLTSLYVTCMWNKERKRPRKPNSPHIHQVQPSPLQHLWSSGHCWASTLGSEADGALSDHSCPAPGVLYWAWGAQLSVPWSILTSPTPSISPGPPTAQPPSRTLRWAHPKMQRWIKF